MVKPAYTPERGDIVWLTFTPQPGHEQTGRRPALVLSPGAYNGKVGLALLCPITSQVKGYPFEVAVPVGLPISGVVLADQVKSLDWRARNAELAGKLPAGALEEVLQKLQVLLDTQPEARK
ncbi:MAG: endoribonuclease MazF [Caldilinea sp.]|nr:endoribonuclease MazF [Caldilineaceae bacterium]MCB9120958.1 endoribonuclease MazF [Caldilineaceae bacterium]MCO5210584.1 endoribonuclease MazF [Caldilinea sp.]MCW5844846.1 endoribonuclease MazF [Caldilinea sp.]